MFDPANNLFLFISSQTLAGSFSLPGWNMALHMGRKGLLSKVDMLYFSAAALIDMPFLMIS